MLLLDGMLIRTFLVLLSALALEAADARPIAAISHRGEHLHHVENTHDAFEAAFKAGATYFECDVRTTSDGKLVLMHDSRVDRTTDGKGEVSALTFEQIRALHPRVPTFDEALAFAHGKIGIYIDSKRLSAQDLVDAVERHHMAASVVVYGDPAFLKQVGALRPDLRLMPEAGSLDRVSALIEMLHPLVFAFDAKDFQDDIIAAARAAKADIFVDRLGPADTPASWQDAIDRGATGIQTDKPAELVDYLRQHGYTVARP